ncbi:MAG: hypothetical protein R2867_36240 [Caldilineaceae bacterium]
MSPPDTPAFYHEIGAMADTGALLNLPMNYDRPGYLLYQTVHHKPLAVAYISRDDPRTLTERVPVLQHFRHLGPDIIAIDPIVVGTTVLHDLGIGLVVQDRYKMPGGLERAYTEALANAIFADQPPLYADERITVNVVQPPATPEPYVMLGALHWGPLLIAENGTRTRMPTQQGATLDFFHVTPTMKLQLRYRTLPYSELDILRKDGTATLAILPPAPAGRTVTLALDELGKVIDAKGEDLSAGLMLQPSMADGVWVEEVSLVP